MRLGEMRGDIYLSLGYFLFTFPRHSAGSVSRSGVVSLLEISRAERWNATRELLLGHGRKRRRCCHTGARRPAWTARARPTESARERLASPLPPAPLVPPFQNELLLERYRCPLPRCGLCCFLYSDPGVDLTANHDSGSGTCESSKTTRAGLRIFSAVLLAF